jgi:uncharacterized protein (TIGR00251 family)
VPERAETVAIRVQPRASRSEIQVRPDGSIAVRLTAPPVAGAANRALVEFLADALGVPKSAVEIVAGARSREKRIRVAGLSAKALLARLRERAG